jgi:hypothetical protein
LHRVAPPFSSPCALASWPLQSKTILHACLDFKAP